MLDSHQLQLEDVFKPVSSTIVVKEVLFFENVLDVSSWRVASPQFVLSPTISTRASHQTWSGSLDFAACLFTQASDDTEPEQNEMKDIYEQLAETTSLVKTLSQQLGDLRDKVVPC